MIQQLGKNKYNLIVNIQLEGKKRIRKSKTVYCGKREANRLYAEFEKEVKADTVSTCDKIYDAMNKYIDFCRVNGRSANTIKGYEVVRNRLISLLPNKKMDKVKSIDIEKMVAEMSNKSSPKTIKNTVSFLSQVYEREIRLGRATENPCKNVKLPSQVKEKVKTLPKADLPRYIQGLDDVDIDTRVALELALFCGMRRSEILGLREADVSLEHNTVIVRNTRHRVKNMDIEQGTKTARSRRVLSLPSFVATDIKKLIEEHDSYDFETSDSLIQNGFGEPLNPSTLTSRSIRFCKDHNLSETSMHKLRHTFASMLLNSNEADIVQISAELGHSNTSITLNVYGHLVEDASASSRHISSIVENFATFSATSENENP